MSIEINGVAHTFITAGDYPRARDFYRRLLPFFGLKEVMDNAVGYYCIGGRTGFGVEPPAAQYAGERFVQARVGLHHICFRARSRADVDATHAFLVSIGAAIVHPPQEDGYAPGYYSLLFEDPDGVRLELNHVPGRGLLTEEGAARPVGSS